MAHKRGLILIGPTRFFRSGGRHTTSTPLLQAGVDINSIRAWLGHVSLDTTTHIYAEIDLAAKAKALARCEVAPALDITPWRENVGLVSLLRSLRRLSHVALISARRPAESIVCRFSAT